MVYWIVVYLIVHVLHFLSFQTFQISGCDSCDSCDGIGVAPRNTPGLTDVCFMKTIAEGNAPSVLEKPGVVSGAAPLEKGTIGHPKKRLNMARGAG